MEEKLRAASAAFERQISELDVLSEPNDSWPTWK
jgi:hypothetical protein